MPRFFIAIDLPDDRSETVAALRDDGLDARWTPTDQYHVTIRFIGEMDVDRVQGIRTDLRDVESDPFSLSGEGIDVFPSRRRPRVLVARLSEHPKLERLRGEIERVVLRHGCDPDDRPFSPHVTFARVRRGNPREVRRYLREHAETRVQPFPVTEFLLYRSDLQPSGAVHTVLENYELR